MPYKDGNGWEEVKEDGNAGLATSTLESAIDQFNSFLARRTSIDYTDYSRIMVVSDATIGEWKGHQSLLVEWKATSSP